VGFVHDPKPKRASRSDGLTRWKKESLKSKEVKHVRSEKVEQLFRGACSNMAIRGIVMEESKDSKTSVDTREPRKALPPAAQRALAEAEERRRLAAQAATARPKEINGRDGPEPARYGDWEVKGIASDF
jgi:hypothetical protein